MAENVISLASLKIYPKFLTTPYTPVALTAAQIGQRKKLFCFVCMFDNCKFKSLPMLKCN
jgi:hypothetical protein